MKFSKLGAMMLCFVFLLAACGKESDEKINASTEPKVDLSEYPNGVQIGNVSLDYYMVLTETRLAYEELHDGLKEINEFDTESKKDAYRKYLLYINGLKYTTSNDNEKEIDNYFSSFVRNSKLYAESTIKFLDSKSSIDQSVMNSFFSDSQNDILMTFEVMNKFELFAEK